VYQKKDPFSTTISCLKPTAPNWPKPYQKTVLIKQTRYWPPVDELAETDQLSNQDGAGVDQALVYLFRVDHPAKELVEAGRPIPIHKEGFKY